MDYIPTNIQDGDPRKAFRCEQFGQMVVLRTNSATVPEKITSKNNQKFSRKRSHQKSSQIFLQDKKLPLVQKKSHQHSQKYFFKENTVATGRNKTK